jgi:dienelactone hydrolase
MLGCHRPSRAVSGIAALAVGALVVCACASAGPSSSSARSDETTTSTRPVPTAGRPFAFTVRHERFVDANRPTASPGDPAYSPRRTLPTDLYIPTASTPRPLIMFSHGYHGAPRKFSQLFRAWARAGYMVAAPRFPLTSDRGDPYDEVADVVNQPGDISFVLTQLLDGSLKSRIDASRIAAAGLSLGGATTYGLVESPCCIDHRFRSAALFDAVRLPLGAPFRQNTIPLLIAHIDTDLAVPYRTAKQAYAESASPKWLLTFESGIHPEAYENTPSPHDRTATQTSLDFFDLTLLGDASARARLLHDGTNPGESTIVAG